MLDGLRSPVPYDLTYFDKIVVSLLPPLEQLPTGKIAQLLAPNYSDLSGPRPISDWMQVIRKRTFLADHWTGATHYEPHRPTGHGDVKVLCAHTLDT